MNRFTTRTLSLNRIAEIAKLGNFSIPMPDAIRILKDSLVIDVNAVPIFYTKNGTFMNNLELIFAFKNLDKIWIDRYTGELHDSQLNDSCYPCDKLRGFINRIYFEQCKAWEEETDFVNKKRELDKDFYGNRPAINALDDIKTRASKKDLHFMIELDTCLTYLDGVIIEIIEER